MTKEVQQYVIERSKELIAAATACQETLDRVLMDRFRGNREGSGRDREIY